NPYLVVVAVTEKMLTESSDTVKNFVAATREGWKKYLQDPSATNKEIAKLNKAFDLPTLQESAEIQKPLIQVEGQTLGSMQKERWELLSQQLKEIGLIKKTLPPS